MKLLVTGHRGMLGSACCRLFSISHDVLTINCNLTNEPFLRYWFAESRPDYVIHCAAKVGGVKVNRDYPVDFLLDNMLINNSVIRACADFGVKKLINVGTSCLYPKECPLPVKEESLMTGPFDPSVEAYAVAKLAAYRLCKAYADQYGKNFMTVAPCNLYGPGDNYGPSAHVIPALIRKFFESKSTGVVPVWGDGSAIREFMHVDDAAMGIAAVLNGWNSPEIINLGTGIGTTIKELVEALQEVSGLNSTVEWDTSKPTGIKEKTFDISKLRSLGFTPTIKLKEGLQDAWTDFVNCPNPRFK